GELREAVRASSSEVERLSQLAEDLLLIAQAERGRLPLRVEQVPIDTLLSSVVRRFDWRAEALGKEINAGSAADASVEGDRLRLEQALGNLVDNALRYGGSTLSLTGVVADDHVELHVRDDGDGFADGFLPHAFDRFTRADPARSGGGAGLGLAIVDTIARAHG